MLSIVPFFISLIVKSKKSQGTGLNHDEEQQALAVEANGLNVTGEQQILSFDALKDDER
jgi:hypothetical protein